ncbi:MAG: hypothetical protein ACKO0M_05700 [Cyanobium sp.]
MVFKPKFFLDLSSEGEEQKPATIAPPVARPAAAEKAPVTEAPVTRPSAASEPTPAVAPTTSQTTAEAIAAELAAAQANRPAPSLETFAPACVTAGGALPRARRRSGADLGGFREMARGMLRS